MIADNERIKAANDAENKRLKSVDAENKRLRAALKDNAAKLASQAGAINSLVDGSVVPEHPRVIPTDHHDNSDDSGIVLD